MACVKFTDSCVFRDSFSFAIEIKTQDLLFMTSLDVDSLFANIPLSETLNICRNKLFHKKNKKIKGLEKREFRDLLELATKESLFLFDRKYYSQIDGVAKGSPLGPTSANIFLCHYEEIWLKDCPPQFKPSFYKRYVDDIFILFENSNQVNEFDKYLNSRHSNMNFSKEQDSSISLLDILISRNQNRNSFVTSIYRKPTFSGIYLYFRSYAPMIYK